MSDDKQKIEIEGDNFGTKEKEVVFPSNSHSIKNPKGKNLENKRRSGKIIKGKVVKQKKSFSKRIKELFIADNEQSVMEYILYDVLVPAAKDMISNTVKDGIEVLLFGEKKSRNINRDRDKSYVPYHSYHKSTTDKRSISPSGRARHDFDEIILETREEAEDVLAHIFDLTIDYGLATVADLYDSVGIESNFTDDKYGWTDLRDSCVHPVRGGYLIDLPRPRLLD